MNNRINFKSKVYNTDFKAKKLEKTSYKES
jgi:hypothetical protein